jgi:DNA-binding transcriptional regulator LsrR (DeoR family)
LKERFGLEDAVVVPDPALPQNLPKAVGTAAGIYVSEQLKDGMRIGVGWGSTLQESLQTLEAAALSDVEVVSLLGGIVQARRFNPAEFAWQFASAIGADCYLLAAPAVVDSLATKEALIERCGLNQVLERSKQLDMALLSVGSLSQQSTSFRFGFFSEAERQELLAKKAVGDLLLHFYDGEGRLVDHSINERVMAMPIDWLKRVPKRVLISGGIEKVEALLGALRLVNGNVLVTNEGTARALLATA